MPGIKLSLTMCSLKQMPQAWTLIRTWPWPGVGISRSRISKSAPGFGTTAIFIFGIEFFLVNFDVLGYGHWMPGGLGRLKNRMERSCYSFAFRVPAVCMRSGGKSGVSGFAGFCAQAGKRGRADARADRGRPSTGD